MKDFLKSVFGRGENLPPKLPKRMEVTDLPMGSIPPPIPSNKGSGLSMSSLPPPFPKGAFVAGGMGFGVLPPPLPATHGVKVATDDDFDDYFEPYQTIDPIQHPEDPLRHAFDMSHNS